MAQRVFEEIRVSAEELIDTLKDIITEGNVRRVIVKSKRGKKLVDIPLNVAGVAAGAGLAVLSPWIAALGIFVLFYNDFNIIVERAEPKEIEAEFINIDDDEEEEEEENERRENKGNGDNADSNSTS